MQNVWFKSRTRDVCGCFVVAVSFAEGNVRANGACDRVVRVVRCRGNSVAGAAYAAVRSHALAHIRHATPLYVLMHLHTHVMLRCCTFSCTCTHTSCYAAVRSHDDDDDDDDEIAPDAKVSFFSVLWSPPVKCLTSDNSGGLLRCPAPCFSIPFF